MDKNEMTVQHTPIPWFAHVNLIIGATPEDGQIGGAHATEDAEFIVKAVNHHDELVEILEKVVAQPPEGWSVADGMNLLAKCQAVLAKVKGATSLEPSPSGRPNPLQGLE